MTTTMTKRTRGRWWLLLWGLMALAAAVTAVIAVPPYLTGNPDLSAVPLNPTAPTHLLSLALHALPAGIALLVGPIQFVPRMRKRFPKAHRITGRVYAIGVLLGAIVAVFAATFSVSGLPAQIGFYVLAAAWVYTLFQAIRMIRQGEIQLHRIWMIRNYALTFSAVLLRVYLGASIVLLPTFPFEEVYTASVWGAIVGNVMVAEYFIVQRTLTPLVRRRRPSGAAPRTTAEAS